MYAVDNPEPRLLRMSRRQILPAARLLYNLFPPAGVAPFTWLEVTETELAFRGEPDTVPFGDEVAELFATVGYDLDLVKHAPHITDMVIHVALLDATGDHLRARALDHGFYAWQDRAAPVPSDTGRLPDTALWVELHYEAKRPWLAAAAGILSAAGAHIVAQHGEQP